MNFPIFKTKSPKGAPAFDLNSPRGRAAYFQYKAGPEIEKLRHYLKTGTFLALLLGKKGAGKGTYSKLFAEALAVGNIAHVSVGDIVRAVDGEVSHPAKRRELVGFLNKNYRGYTSVDEIITAFKKTPGFRLEMN